MQGFGRREPVRDDRQAYAGGGSKGGDGNTLDGCQWQEYPDMVYDRVLETPLQAVGAPCLSSGTTDLHI